MMVPDSAAATGAAGTPPPTDEDAAVLARIRRLRRDRAGGRPAYSVLDNATLDRLVALRPRTRRALARVPGMGPARVDALADDLLSILRELPDAAPIDVQLALPKPVHQDLAAAACDAGHSIETEAALGLGVYVATLDAVEHVGFRRQRRRRPE